MKSPCTVVREACEYVGAWIGRRPNLQEESITDWLLDYISNECNSIIYLAFSKHQEARSTGADWEWWLVYSTTYAIRIRVQAKRLSANDNRLGLAYQNKHGFQHDKLIADANRVNAIPFYSFYSGAVTTGKCSNIQSQVIVCEANAARTLYFNSASKPIPEADVFNISVPLECIFCCPLTMRHRWHHFMEHYFPDNVGASTNSSDLNETGVHRQLPAFVEAMLNTNILDKSWIENEFSHDLSGVCGLLVFDLRERSSEDLSK